MFKLIQVIQPATRFANMVPQQNTFQTFVVAMPEKLMPILQQRIFGVIIHRYNGTKQLADLTIPELIDLETFMFSYTDAQEHLMILDGRMLSLLKRFLASERVYIGQQRQPVTEISNDQYWALVGDLLLSTIRATQLVKLSFGG